MISGFRKSLRSWATVLLLFIALVAIVVTGFGTDGFGGLGSLGGGQQQSETLATVGGEPVEASEISDMLNRAFANARAQQPTLDMAAFLQQGAFEELLNQSITAEAIRQYAAERGLVASDLMVDREIVNIPAFRNFTGQFDQAAFRGALARERITEARLRDDIARSLIQRQLLGPVALGIRVPESVAREYASLLLERRRGVIGGVPAELLAAGIAPTDAQLATFYRQNGAAFTIPERRVLKYAVIGPDQVATAAAATEAEIARVYQNSRAAYGPRETRTIQSIVLPTQQAAQAFAQRVRGGTSFVDAASQAGFSAGDVTFADQSRAQFEGATNAEVAAAAFAAAQGAVAGPVRSELGFHVVRVDRITSVPARPLEAVRGDIARAIAQRKQGDAMNALIGRIEDQIADGATVDEAARAAGLTVVTTPPITAAGQAVGGAAYAAPAELRAVLTTAFEIDAEDPEPVVEQLPNQPRFVLLGLERAEPAAPPPLAQIREQVRIAYIQRTAMARAKAVADRIAAAINRGTPAARAFAEAQPRLPAAETVEMQRIQISRAGQQVPEPLITLFSIPQGRARVLRSPANNGWFVVAHERRTAGDAAGNAALINSTRTEFNRTASEEFARQFARAVERGTEINRDEAAIGRARRSAGGGVLPAE